MNGSESHYEMVFQLFIARSAQFALRWYKLKVNRMFFHGMFVSLKMIHSQGLSYLGLIILDLVVL